MKIKKINTADKVLIFIILLPVFSFSLKLFLELNQKPNLMSIAVYTITLLLVVIGIVLADLAKSRESNVFLILSCSLTFLGIFGTFYLAFFVLNDISSLIFISIILIFLFLIFLLQR